MRNTPVFVIALLMLGSTASFAQSQQQQGPTLESRVQRIERILENQILREMLDRLEQIQRETRELRGELESHNHRIDGLKRRQRELYIDVDRRLHAIERGGITETPVTVGSGEAIPEPSQSTAVAPTASSTGQEQASQPAAAPAAAVQAGEHDAYEKAFNLLREGRYEQAESAFKSFMAKYPQGRYSANAQYWLGEVFYLRRDFENALSEFNKVVKDHPDSPKRANALLKIGFVNYEKGDWKAARSALESVVRDHKGHSAARLAANRLNQMTQEGH
ncbi:MAG: tol-pal system protein YbgF [Gammaproteobacteria bacterium]